MGRATLAFILLGALFLGAPGQSRAGTLTGVLDFQKGALLTTPYQTTGYWKVENGIVPIAPATISISSEVFLVLQGGAPPMASGTLPLLIDNASYSPTVLAILTGMNIQFENRDIYTHNVTSTNPTLAIGEIKPGETKVVAASQEGEFELRDATMPHMWGKVVVLKGVRVARVGEGGRFAFGGEIPAGTYTLKVYAHSGYVKTQEITIPEVGNLELQIPLSPSEVQPMVNNVAQKGTDQ